MARRTAIEVARRQTDLANAKADRLLADQRLRRVTVLAKYDATSPDNRRKRRQSPAEFGDEGTVLPHYERLQGIALARDLHRNFSPARGILNQFAVNVVGTEGGALFQTDDATWNEATSEWYNDEWSLECDARQDLTRREMFVLAVISRKRDGAVLCVFDDFSEEADGKLLWYEADQLVAVNASDWKEQKLWTETITNTDGTKTTVPMKQSEGFVYTQRGTVKAYVVTGKHGLTEAKFADVTIIPTTSARLWKTHFRFNQHPGISELITAAADLQDLYEMRAAELQSAKRTASEAFIVKRQDALQTAIEKGGTDANALIDATSQPTQPPTAARNYERLEAMSGGKTEYIDPLDDVEQLENKRPSTQIQPFFEWTLGGAGWGMGVASFYSTGKATASYTAFRGEMLSTWGTFLMEQQSLEGLARWIAVKAVTWKLGKGGLTAAPAGWERKITHQWPDMPEINTEVETGATLAKLKGALTTYQDRLGPNWRKIFKQHGEELKAAKAEQLPLPEFETTSGAPADKPATAKTNGSDTEK